VSVQRFKQEVKTFEFEGIKIGLRFPKTAEMEEITRLREPWARSLRRAMKDPVEHDQDYKALGKLQVFVSSTLCCDPDNIDNPWFADTPEKQKELANAGIAKDIPSDVPHVFHVKAFEAFTNLFEKEAADRQQEDPSEPTVPSTPAEPVETETLQTTSD